MHRGHDHDHPHRHDGAGGGHSPAGAGHNRPAPRAVQWQTPHRQGAAVPEAADVAAEPDLDLVERAFVEGFATATDPTSFLRLARVPFEAIAVDGTRLVLLRVEAEELTDVGGVTPHLGGASFRYDPLPARIASRRQRLRFVYFDGTALRPLSLAETRALAPATPPGG